MKGQHGQGVGRGDAGAAAMFLDPPSRPGHHHAEKHRRCRNRDPEGLTMVPGGSSPNARAGGRTRALRRPGMQPGVNLGGEGIDTGPRAMGQPVNGKALLLLPKLDGAGIAVEIGGDHLPTVEPHIRGGVISRRAAFWTESHGNSHSGARKDKRNQDKGEGAAGLSPGYPTGKWTAPGNENRIKVRLRSKYHTKSGESSRKFIEFA